MIYTVKCDDNILYNQYMDNALLADSDWHQIDNEFGSFNFTIYDDNSLYNSIVLKKSRIKIYKDGVLKWLGRPIDQTDEIDGAKTFYCEGCLGFFNDSVIRPFEFNGSPELFFAFVVNSHNDQVSEDQRFIIGECHVTDPNDYITRSSQSYNKTWKLIIEKMLNLGGHLVVTFDQNEKPILSWMNEITAFSAQPIKFGENLVEYERSLLYSEFYTACIPLGCKYDDGSRLTIESENDGKDYLVNTTLANTYGVIYADPEETIWDDVTLASNLKTKGQNWLNNVGVKYKKVINLTAEDISFLMENVPNAELDYMVNVVFDTNSGQTVYYLVVDFDVDIRDPYSASIVIAEESSEYAESALSKVSQREQSNIVQRVGNIEADYVTNQQVSSMAALIANEQIENSTYIQQTVENVIIQALQEYTKSNDFERFSSTVLTNLSVLAGEISANFSSVSTSVSNLGNSTRTEFDSIYSFIRLLAEIQQGGVVTQEGGVVIGKSTSDIKLKLQNNILYFFTGDEKIVTTSNAIAWFASNQLYVNNTTIQNLTLGTSGAYLDARIVGSGDNRCVLWSGRLA